MKVLFAAGKRAGLGLVLLAGASLAACGGGGGSGPGPTPPTKVPFAPKAPTPPPSTPTPSPVPTSSPPMFATPTPAPTSKANVIFEVGVPTSSQYTYAHGRRPLYVSPATKSVNVVDTGGAPTTAFNVGAPYCQNTTTTVWCQFYETVAQGNHNFTLTLYSGSSATGSQLSIGNTGPVTLTSTSSAQQSVTLKAVIASIQLSLATPNPPVGAPDGDTLHIALLDAAGDTIASDSQYNPADALYNPVTLSSSDTANGPLNRTALNLQSDVSGIYAGYNGAKVGPITYSASCSTVSCTVQNATLTP